MSFLKIVKFFYWDLLIPTERFSLLYHLFFNMPGRAGDEIRSNLVSKKFKRCGENLRIFQGVRFRNIQNIEAGNNVAIGTDSFLEGAGGITFGNYVQLGPGVKIWTIQHRKNDTSKTMLEQQTEMKPVVIGNNVWLASNVFVMPGAQIGDWCVISAGAVVSGKTIPPYSIVAGNPARKIGIVGDGVPADSASTNQM
jgi:acetyltransferase-like isoleucine patch superfamily enzyme